VISEIKVAISFPALASSTNCFKSLAKSTALAIHYTGSTLTYSNFFLSAFSNSGLSERNELEGIINNISNFFSFDIFNDFSG